MGRWNRAKTREDRESEMSKLEKHYPYELAKHVGDYQVHLPFEVVEHLNKLGGLRKAYKAIVGYDDPAPGHFGSCIYDDDLRGAWMRADFNNRTNLSYLTGMTVDELEKFAYESSHPDDKVNYTLSKDQYGYGANPYDNYIIPDNRTAEWIKVHGKEFKHYKN